MDKVKLKPVANGWQLTHIASSVCVTWEERDYHKTKEFGILNLPKAQMFIKENSSLSFEASLIEIHDKLEEYVLNACSDIALRDDEANEWEQFGKVMCACAYILEEEEYDDFGDEFNHLIVFPDELGNIFCRAKTYEKSPYYTTLMDYAEKLPEGFIDNLPHTCSFHAQVKAMEGFSEANDDLSRIRFEE